MRLARGSVSNRKGPVHVGVFRETTLTKNKTTSGTCLHQFVRQVTRQYLDDMGSTPPDNLHALITGEVEKALISTVLDHTGNNQSRAAEILGMTRTTLRSRVRRYEID
ncbi:MAG: hypothetical protein EA370_02820 [Wenzhouxiangella sp.]|nr:MAG: hypothetical protein EA370_02820 [Wenzhouxiangella sp.]